MPTNYPQILLASRLCESGDKTLPPATAAQAGTGRFSQAEGWKLINATPLADGGIPPDRTDFNGVLYLLSQFALWQQQGGLMNWTSTLAYEVGNEVLYNGTKYRCIQAGANKLPTNKAYWKNLDIPSVRPGMVVSAYNVSVDSSGHPIFWGETDADTDYLLCDGRSDGLGGNVPNLIDRCIRGSTPATAGQTGGADSVTLGVNQLPSHTHSISLESNGAHSHTTSVTTTGAHTHGRGTMEITGSLGFRKGVEDPRASGAFTANFSVISDSSHGKESYGRSGDWYFKASDAWTGATSSEGNHTHGVTVNSAGAHTHTASASNTGSGASVDIKNPFFTMAYFIKLPE